MKCNNGVLVCVNESERKWRKSIQVEGLQGVNVSHDVVVGGEEKASRAYLEDTWSTNSRLWIFCAPHRWCSNKVVVSPFVYHEFIGKAQLDHDNVVLPFAWNDRDKDFVGYDVGYFCLLYTSRCV